MSITKRLWELRVHIAVVVVFLVFVQVNGWYSNRQHQVEQLSEIGGLRGTGWCENQVISRSGQTEFVSQDGWPCIKIDRVESVRLEGSNYCAEVTFAYQTGQFGYSGVSRRKETICTPEKYDSWGFKDQLYQEHVSVQLTILNQELCATFSDSMSPEEQGIYCND